MRIEEGFQITAYKESHPYLDDPVLPSLLRRLLPEKHLHEIEADLTRFGDSITHEYRSISSTVSPPQLTQFDQLGRRIDRLDTSEGWRALKDIAIKEGIVAIPHERKQQEFSRVYGFAKMLMFAGDSHVVLCPMAMTDGAARVLELFGTEEMQRDIIHSRLISRDPLIAFTSGQWMTERPGGSDVSQTETTATPVHPSSNSKRGSLYSLNGFKWFSSATDSNISIALARTGSVTSGSKGLSLFVVLLRLPLLPHPSPSPMSNGILIHRLKNKIGTHALPTAELSLNNTHAYLLSPLNEGVKSITPLLNITRVYSAITVIGYLRRALDIARSYALVRKVRVPNSLQTQAQANTLQTGSEEPIQSSQLLKDNPLHMSVLANTTTTYQALTHFAFNVVLLLGKSECRKASENEIARLRFLTPVLKAFASERAVEAMKECMTCLGGLGYMEEVGIGRLVRDGLVEQIWEGTTNVLALDMIRASQKTFPAYLEWATHISTTLPNQLTTSNLQASITSLTNALSTLSEAFNKSSSRSNNLVLRPLLYLVGHTTASLYLLEHVVWECKDQLKGAQTEAEKDRNRNITVFKRYVENTLDSLRIEVETMMGCGSVSRVKDDLEIVYNAGETPGVQVSSKL